MRTTVMLPPELMRAAKARSAESGESLKSFLTRAVAAELAVHNVRPGQRARVKLPLFGSPAGPRIRLTNADIEQVLADEDAAALARVSPSRPAHRRGRAR
jgi:hypothetical protein